MAARQLWVFLAPQDVPALVARIAAREPGLIASEGRYLRGDVRALLGDPAKLERREALPNERRLYLFHQKHSQDLLAHEQPHGPFAGWSQIDEERSDCLVLRVPIPDGQRGPIAEPSRLYAHTSFWRGGDKIRKRPPFALWANQTLRWLLGELPPSSVKFMRLGANAQQQALAGTLRLTYLLRTIAPQPAASLPAASAPSLPARETSSASSSSNSSGSSSAPLFAPEISLPAGVLVEGSSDDEE